MESLETINAVHKLLGIISRIIFICSILLMVICFVGMVCVPTVFDSSMTIDGEAVKLVVERESGETTGTIIANLIKGMLCGLFSTIIAGAVCKYCKLVKEAETPFDDKAASKLFSCGIVYFVFWCLVNIAISVTEVAVEALMHEVVEVDKLGVPLLGVVFIFVSYVLRYGIELKDGYEERIALLKEKLKEKN